MNTGLFFGSFNPVHIGHLAIAGYMLEYTDLEQVWFVPSPHNPFKKKESLLPFHHRLEMLHLAIDDDLRFRISDIESKMPEPSFTIDTLAFLSEKNPGRKFALIMGSDNLKGFEKWKNSDEIVRKYHRYIYPRIDADIDLKDHRNLSLVNAPRMEISSSFIRKAISEGKDVRYLLPPKVYEYIVRMNFYKN